MGCAMGPSLLPHGRCPFCAQIVELSLVYICISTEHVLYT